MKWNGSYSGIPKYAVIAGDAMEDDSNMYFARHNENDQEVHVGWYHSSWPTATFSCGSNVKSFKNFEVIYIKKIIYNNLKIYFRFSRTQTIRGSLN